MKISVKNNLSTPMRFNLFVGAVLLSIVLLGVLTLGTLITIWIHPYNDAFWWIYPGTSFSVAFICFAFRLYGWCNKKHFILSLVFVIGIPLLLLTFGFHFPYYKVGIYLAFLTMFGLIAAPGIMAMYIASPIAKRVRSPKIRIIILLLISVPPVTFFSMRWISNQVIFFQSSKHSVIMGEPNLKVNANELKNTIVVPTLEHPISQGTNLIWCATTQLAWNELCELIGEDIQFEPYNIVSQSLNKKTVASNDIDDSTYIAIAGFFGNGILDSISSSLNAKFDGATTPELLPSSSDFSNNAFIAYSYLFVNLPFIWAFERLDSPLKFQGKEVKCFGIDQYMKSQMNEYRAAGQILIYSFLNKNDFIVELKTNKAKHKLILAKVPPARTFEETIMTVQKRIERSKPDILGEGQDFIVPLLNFDIQKDYEEFIGKPLVVNNKLFKGRQISIFKQQTRFVLNERGAKLKSEALIAYCKGQNLVFDKPFLIMLQYKETKKPYFVIWVDNPEILIESAIDKS